MQAKMVVLDVGLGVPGEVRGGMYGNKKTCASALILFQVYKYSRLYFVAESPLMRAPRNLA